MSIYSNVTEQDLINLRQLAEQHKTQQAPKIENRFLKQAHDINLAWSLSPITKKNRCHQRVQQKNRWFNKRIKFWK